jgi:hypothetical protein
MVKKRDPAKTALNKKIKGMTETLKLTEEHVRDALGEPTVLALHGRIGGKNAEFIDVKNEVISSSEEYVALWIRGFLRVLEERRPLYKGDPYYDMYLAMKKDKVVEDYIITFQKRTYLRHCDALSRVRPQVEDAEVWIGQENASYGILVTPRFVKGEWENDKSEIRKFPQDYWTIGHVMATGLVVPNDPDKIEFKNVKNYLAFFKNTLVRASGSKHERAVAERYVKYVLAQPDPNKVPLLIPEFRYGGTASKHRYRLDFTVIDPYSMQKIGFELSPWSSHGQLTGVKGKTQAQVNADAKANFEKEMKKHKDYFRKHGVYALIYTDNDLANPDALFEEIRQYLVPTKLSHQLEIHALDELHRFKP